MSFVQFCYKAWVKKMDWNAGQLSVDPDKVIHDGDSGYVFMDNGKRIYDNSNFRLYGVNTPELNAADPAVRAKAVAARDWLRAEILGKQVYLLSKGCEKYGRTLLIIWTAEADFGDNLKSVNKKMITLGHAVPYLGELV